MAFLSEPEDIVFLVPTEGYQDDEGAWHDGKRERHPAICRSVTYAALTRAQLRSSDVRIENMSDIPYVGMKVMAVVELWTLDYNGEEQAIFRGEEVQVEADTTYGPKTQLILRQRLGNVTDDNVEEDTPGTDTPGTDTPGTDIPDDGGGGDGP